MTDDTENPKKKGFKILLGWLLSGGLLTWLGFSVDWGAVGEELVHVRWAMLIPVTLGLCIHYLLRSWRWKFLLPPDRSFSLRDSFDAIMIGNFATYILPLRAGEFVRPLLYSKERGVSFSTCFASVVVERFFDLSVVLLSFAYMTPHVAELPPWVNKGVASLSILALAILGFISVSAFKPALAKSVVVFMLRPLPDKFRNVLQHLADELLDGAQSLRTPQNLLATILLSAAVWSSGYFLFEMYFWLLGIEGSYFGALVVSVIVALAVAAPSAPGFVGIYQTGCVAGFALLGLSRESAVAFSLITHVLQYVIFCAYGMFFLLSRGLTLRSLTAKPVA